MNKHIINLNKKCSKWASASVAYNMYRSAEALEIPKGSIFLSPVKVATVHFVLLMYIILLTLFVTG